MQSITKYSFLLQPSFTLSLPQYSHFLCVNIQTIFGSGEFVKFYLSVLSDNQWPLVERQFYLFKENERFNMYSGKPNDYYLPITYVDNFYYNNNVYYLFVKDENE